MAEWSLDCIWWFPKIMGNPQIIPFCGIFHEINQLFLGYPRDCGNPHKAKQLCASGGLFCAVEVSLHFLLPVPLVPWRRRCGRKTMRIEIVKQMGVSIHGGIPKWLVYNGKFHENGWWLGVPLFQETSKCQRDQAKFQFNNHFDLTWVIFHTQTQF